MIIDELLVVRFCAMFRKGLFSLVNFDWFWLRADSLVTLKGANDVIEVFVRDVETGVSLDEDNRFVFDELEAVYNVTFLVVDVVEFTVFIEDLSTK